jgi:hypothetical protein
MIDELRAELQQALQAVQTAELLKAAIQEYETIEQVINIVRNTDIIGFSFEVQPDKRIRCNVTMPDRSIRAFMSARPITVIYDTERVIPVTLMQGLAPQQEALLMCLEMFLQRWNDNINSLQI